MFNDFENLTRSVVAKRDELDIGDAELARRAGVSRDVVRKWLASIKGDKQVVVPGYTTVSAVMEALGMDTPPPMLPFHGTVGASIDKLHIPPDENDSPLIRVPFHIKNGFVVKLSGDSMDKEIMDGYHVVIKPVEVDNQALKSLHGKMLLVSTSEGTCIKMWDNLARQLEPRSSNTKDHKPHKYDPAHDVIHGVVMQAFKNYEA